MKKEFQYVMKTIKRDPVLREDMFFFGFSVGVFICIIIAVIFG